MADTKLSALTAITSLDDADLLLTTDTSATQSKKITRANFVTDMAQATQTLTNKSIDQDGTGNSITNLANASIKSAAAIAVNKLAALTVSELVISDGSGFLASAPVATYPSLAELIHVKGVTSAIQTQLDSKGTGTPEGTAILSTGETVGKVLQADGDDTCSWVALVGGGDALTANPLSQFAATTSAQLAGVLSDETGSGAFVLATSPTLVTPLLGTPTSGVLTNCTGTASGLTAGSVTSFTPASGSLTLSGADAVTLTTTATTNITLPTTGTVATLTGTETLTGKTLAAESNTATIFTESHASSHTLSASECYGGVYYVTAAATLTLPAVADGMHISVHTIGAVAVSVDPNASDKIWLDGTALDDGDKITNLSTAGDIAVLTYYSADGWHASTNSWTDGGA